MKKITPEDVKQYHFASIFTDFGFKRAFGNEKDTRFLRKTIQILIKSKHEITEVIFDSNDLIGTTKESRAVRFDIFCKDAAGNEYIVEMQLTLLLRFIQRAKFYAFQRFNRMIQKGRKGFDNLKKIYVLSFLDGQLFEGDELHHIVNLKNQHGQLIDDQISYVFIEMGKWDKEEHELKSDFDKLMHFMKYTKTATIDLKLPQYTTYEEWFEGALEQLRTANLSPNEHDAYMLAFFDEAMIREAKERERRELEQEKQKVEREKQKFEQEKQKVEQEKQKVEQEKQKVEQRINQLAIAIVHMFEGGKTKDEIIEILGVNDDEVLSALKKYGHKD